MEYADNESSVYLGVVLLCENGRFQLFTLSAVP